MRARTQDDIVAQQQPVKPKEVTRKVGLPGVAQLHTRSTEEIAEVLAVVLKSERNITRLDWKIGEFIELTTESD